jgi:branched-subunit amino acid aminotransferase/4-amino-4-deoxychorismate lyase
MATLPAPDRAQGLFETLLIAGGEPVELDAHLERLAASLDELFGTALPSRLEERAHERAAGLELGRMRITVTPDRAAELVTEPVDPGDFFPGPERGAELRSLRCDGGLGAHKWADRSALGETRGRTVALLLDRGEEVLEATRANVFAVFDQSLATPRADGRILPGLARAGAIAAAAAAGIEVAERPLTRAELFDADEAFLTGSVRGVEPAAALDGVPLPPPGELSRRVADGLRRHWLAGPAASAAPALAAAPRPGPPAR